MHQLRRPVGLLLRQSDGEVDAQRTGHLPLQEGARPQPRHPPYDLPDEEAEGQGVVARPGARLPPGLGGREARGGQLPVVELLERVRLAQPGQTRAVGQQVPHQHPLLARGGELRPVRGHRGVEVQQSPVGEDVRAQRRGPLRRGPHVDQRVPLPRACARRVGPAAPQVGHRHAVDRHAHRGAELGPVPEVLLEGGAQCGEPRVAVAVDLWHVLGHGPSVGRSGRPDRVGAARTPLNVPTGRTGGKAIGADRPGPGTVTPGIRHGRSGGAVPRTGSAVPRPRRQVRLVRRLRRTSAASAA